MAKMPFEHSLKIILKHEGGYVNHPEDPGGETNLGVTKRVYQEFGGTKDMKDLTIEDVTPIYKQQYWDKVRGDDLPTGIDLCVFDFGVNAGVRRAAKYLQLVVGAKADGVIGPKSLEAVNQHVFRYGVNDLIDRYQDARQRYYEKLRHFKTFGRGWTRRVKETTEMAKWMV